MGEAKRKGMSGQGVYDIRCPSPPPPPCRQITAKAASAAVPLAQCSAWRSTTRSAVQHTTPAIQWGCQSDDSGGGLAPCLSDPVAPGHLAHTVKQTIPTRALTIAPFALCKRETHGHLCIACPHLMLTMLPSLTQYMYRSSPSVFMPTAYATGCVQGAIQRGSEPHEGNGGLAPCLPKEGAAGEG